MPSRNQWNWRWICASEHLGALCGQPMAEQAGGISFSLLSGAEVTKPGTTEINSDLNPHKQENSECREGAGASSRDGMGSDPSHLNVLPLWVCNTPNYCFKIIFACNFTIEMCSLFLFC